MLFHPNPDQFIVDAKQYGALGETLVALSNLEFAHDEFIFKMYELHNDLSLSISSSFPRQFKLKTDFLINSIFHVKKLRQTPVFITGELSLQWLQYQFDELYSIRSIVAHGSVTLVERTPDCITWRFEQFVKTNKNKWNRRAIKMSNGYLASVHYSSWAMKRYLWSLIRYLDGSSSWEEDYQEDKIIRKNRITLSDLAEAGVFSDENEFLCSFPPKKPIE